jgi:hypothetical protein
VRYTSSPEAIRGVGTWSDPGENISLIKTFSSELFGVKKDLIDRRSDEHWLSPTGEDQFRMVRYLPTL